MIGKSNHRRTNIIWNTFSDSQRNLIIDYWSENGKGNVKKWRLYGLLLIEFNQGPKVHIIYLLITILNDSYIDTLIKIISVTVRNAILLFQENTLHLHYSTLKLHKPLDNFSLHWFYRHLQWTCTLSYWPPKPWNWTCRQLSCWLSLFIVKLKV